MRKRTRPALIPIAMLAVAFAVAPARAAITPLHHQTSTTLFSGPVSSVVVNDDAGDVDVHPGSTTSVTATARWNLVKPAVTQTLSGGVLKVRARCPQLLLNDCSVDLTLAVPATAVVSVETGAGDIGIAAMRGPSIAADSGAGDVVLTVIGSPVVSASSGAGNVDAGLVVVPSSLSLETGAGDIAAVVPSGVYDLRTDTGSGTVTVTGITRSAASPNRISARTGAGDITIRGR